ncbi:hypothetical protein K9B33_22615 [Sphingobium sp. 3R8]|uniref:hypothetical protein n=1 Tax=Sphingobium sp. 3R8 TaxID=2874921 RepID=UPI001CCB9EAA|nr:hypothetical protein [Sphingobium sp. 3R8]MBZ9650328.1 hypothetical protein [Sphingobium sp. 3R8]
MAERLLVWEAAGSEGSIAERAARLARSVAAAAMAEIDQDEGDRVIALLRQLAPSFVDRLATDPEFSTGALIVKERVRRLEARGGKHLPQSEWCEENRQVLHAVAATLARRYRTFLSDVEK